MAVANGITVCSVTCVYRFFYGKDGKRIVGYDNERAKGDHKHINGVEFPYTFAGIRQLISDFRDDIQQVRQHE